MISAVPSVSSVHVELDGRLPSTAGRTDETTKVPVGVPGDPVLLSLTLPDLELELRLYAAHSTRERPKLADPKVSGRL
jgi:hypothetical protein